mmetsp:Transcript_41042/g.102042  ORF Transcript_41042/g.102042 Transcript_41042/m.102042 type:complete len:100 (+) Transcript_41042:202-501(+)
MHVLIHFTSIQYSQHESSFAWPHTSVKLSTRRSNQPTTYRPAWRIVRSVVSFFFLFPFLLCFLRIATPFLLGTIVTPFDLLSLRFLGLLCLSWFFFVVS